jgi:hypothetical protein
MFKSRFEIQNDFIRLIDFLSEVKATKRELFIDFTDKAIITISNYYRVPISNITTPSLSDIQKKYRCLRKMDNVNSEDKKEFDYNQYKNYFKDLQKSVHSFARTSLTLLQNEFAGYQKITCDGNKRNYLEILF